MTKPEIRMPKEIRNPKSEMRSNRHDGVLTFGLRHSFVIRHSSFVIAHDAHGNAPRRYLV
ncbi:MAG: hypothetical protein DME26_00270 [Verrucomicrobia bacterium]|nr:MAG: hypothetical protein DME26_00270 [Verrucomicrobiota bacterium]